MRPAARPGRGADPLAGSGAALPPGEARQGVLAAPGRRGRGRRDARRGAAPRARRGARAAGRARVRGADRRRRVDRARLDARATGTSSTSSSAPTSPTARSRTSRRTTPPSAALRLFSLDELQEIVLHPPMKRFVERWQPGDPSVYLGSLWIPLEAAAALRARAGRDRVRRRARARRRAAPARLPCASASASSRSANHGLRGSSGPWR